MKITKTKLKQIIKEELLRALNEAGEYDIDLRDYGVEDVDEDEDLTTCRVRVLELARIAKVTRSEVYRALTTEEQIELEGEQEVGRFSKVEEYLSEERRPSPELAHAARSALDKFKEFMREVYGDPWSLPGSITCNGFVDKEKIVDDDGKLVMRTDLYPFSFPSWPGHD